MKSIMEQWQDDYFQEYGTKYSNHVNKFVEYLRKENKLDTPYAITIEDVDKCIGRYAELGKINYRSSMESHLESVKSFYDYLSETGKAADIFNSLNMNYENYKEMLFEKHKLNEGKPRESFPMESVLEILTHLDEDLKYVYEERNDGSKKNPVRALLRIYIKTTLIAPAKKNVICDIKFEDFNSFTGNNSFRWLMINDVKINIPNGLHRDLVNAVTYMYKVSGKPKGSDKLFDYIYGEKFKKESINTWFYTFVKAHDIFDLGDNTKTYPVEPIMITAIQSMVGRMANPALIAKISGVKIGSIESKYYDNRTFNIKYEETIDQAINWEIAKNDYYTYI